MVIWNKLVKLDSVRYILKYVINALCKRRKKHIETTRRTPISGGKITVDVV